MMNRLQELDEIYADYEFQRKTLKLFKLNVKLALKGTVGLSASLLKQSELHSFTPEIAKERADATEKHLADSTILSLWIVFERCLVEYLQNGVTISLRSPISELLYDRVLKDIEWWRLDDKIDMTKSLFDSKLLENLTHIKKYRNWVAHRNPNQQPPNIKPGNAYTYLREAIESIQNS
ncbi:MAG: hypothetical protein EAZ92_03480 [Candidatus Kapaibacterium sp.]|nr:MAG: hypothetical protein EAZ92_03480 [Candidatus Kapabacteria bacterium]